MAAGKSLKKHGPPAVKIAPARQAAFDILREIAASAQTHSDDLLQSPKLQSLSGQDRNLCTALVMGVLRWQLSLDQEIEKHLTHKSKMDQPVRIALRLGVLQLLMMDRIPVHAAISDSVELTKRGGHRFASGLVNAVLRKFATHESLPENNLDAQQAHPRWLQERWLAAYGQENVSAICNYDQQQPAVALRIANDEAELEADMAGLQPGAFLTRAKRLHRDGPVQTARNSALVRVQDEGSQLVAEIAGGGMLSPRIILDCCAAPAGKTAILAERFPDARLVAWDISSKRLAAMRDLFKSSPNLLQIECVVVDAATAPIEQLFDLILCDVPCSGTGTLARNPEIKLRLQPEDLARQQQRQVSILAAALRHLAPGGRLLYSTCSLEAEENEDVVRKALGQTADVHLLGMADRLREMHISGVIHQQGLDHLLEHAVDGEFLRTLPGISPCDGFFAALLSR